MDVPRGYYAKWNKPDRKRHSVFHVWNHTLCVKIEGRRRRGWQRMRWLDGITNSMHESEQTPGDGGGQGSLACCSSRGRKESDTTEQPQPPTSMWNLRNKRTNITKQIQSQRYQEQSGSCQWEGVGRWEKHMKEMKVMNFQLQNKWI